MTLLHVGEDWIYGPATELEESTRRNMSGLIELHIMRWIGTAQVQHIDAAFVKDWQRSLARDGVSPGQRARSLKCLKMLLNLAVENGYLQGNPAMVVKPPKQPAKDLVEPLSPRQVELICEQMQRPMDVIYTRMMAYAGLRPGEAVALPWRAVGKRTLVIRSTKTNRVDSVQILEPLMQDLTAWRSAAPDTSLILERPNREPWSKTALDNWRNRIFIPAAAAAGIRATPYTLRHSFASLLIHAGWSPAAVAQAMRHSVEMTLRTYSHVIQDFAPDEQIDPAQAIMQAREVTTNGHVLIG